MHFLGVDIPTWYGASLTFTKSRLLTGCSEDVIKTRIQSQPLTPFTPVSSRTSTPQPLSPSQRPLLPSKSSASPTSHPLPSSASSISSSGSTQSVPHGFPPQKITALSITRHVYRQGGLSPFFRGLGICSVRAFIVNAVQWAVYEWVMTLLTREKLLDGVA
jgi:hypothetical protein